MPSSDGDGEDGVGVGGRNEQSLASQVQAHPLRGSAGASVTR